MCLPHPGLVPSQAKPRNFSLLREDHTKHSFPMYLEKDLSFAHQLSNMLALYKPKVSDEEIDYYTSESICDYWKKERFERVEGLLTLFSRAPYFHDEFDIDHVDGVRTVTFTFSWRTICQIARKEGMPPFDMLAYVSLVQYGRESGEDYEKLR